MTPDALTDAMARAVVDLIPSAQPLLDGALAAVEPHRNHSRAELARLWTGLACADCTLKYLSSPNHPTGMIFVGWGHGWQACQSCGGSGLSERGDGLQRLKAVR